MGKIVALMGGSFNPPTTQHVRNALLIRNALPQADVWMMVCPQNPFKEKNGMAPFVDRLTMLRLALKGQTGLFACSLEKQIAAPETAGTLRGLFKLFPSFRFVWVMGADCLTHFHTWGDHAFIAASVPLFVLPRPGYAEAARNAPSALLPRLARAAEALTRNGLYLFDGEGENGSATEVRAALRENRPSPLLAETVRAYIKDHGLYL
jgi:nicotinate-nucleotide adenylyltransferase